MRTRRYLAACSEVQQISGMLGQTLGQIIPIPGVGSIISAITGLFGPSAHYTPSGMLYDTAAETLKSQATELADLQNELYQAVGSPTRASVPNWTYTSADDPQTGPYIAKILNNPQYAADTSPAPLIQDQADGVYDAVIQIQKTMISAIENALSGLQDGTLVVSAGRVVSAGSAVAQCANSTTAQNNMYSGVCGQNAAPFSAFLAQNGGYVLAGFGVLGLILLLKRR